MAVAIIDDEIRSAEYPDQRREAHGNPGFLVHLADGSVVRNLSPLDGTAGKDPLLSLNVTGKENATFVVAERNRH